MEEFFGPVAGLYFLDSFDRRDDGWYLHGEVSTFRDISEGVGHEAFLGSVEGDRRADLADRGRVHHHPRGTDARDGREAGELGTYVLPMQATWFTTINRSAIAKW